MYIVNLYIQTILVMSGEFLDTNFMMIRPALPPTVHYLSYWERIEYYVEVGGVVLFSIWLGRLVKRFT